MVTKPIPPRAAAVLARMVHIPAGFPGGFIQLPHGAQMHWAELGTGRPVVLVHGNPSWSFLFRSLMEPLARFRRVLAPDHIGCGLSDKGPPGYRYLLRERVADFGAWIDRVAPQGPIDLVTHDWGGMIALSWAVNHPARVGRLVVMNTAGFGLPEGATIPWSLRLARTPGLGALLVRGYNAFVRGALRHGTVKPVSAEARSGFLAPYANWDERKAVLRFVEDVPLSPGHPSWAMVRHTETHLGLLSEKTMLILWGMRDFVFTSPFLDAWRRLRPDARVVKFPQAGHWLLEDEPAACRDEIVTFLESDHG